MAVVYTYEAKEKSLNDLLSTLQTFQMRLFQNDFTPDNDSVDADFDQCDFSGYNQIGPTWGAVLPDGDGNAATIALVCVFAHDGGGTANDVYGWYLIGDEGGPTIVLYAERFGDAPRVMDTLGDVISITPTMIQGSCP